MNATKWVSRIRAELKCGIVDLYALQNAFEITATRLLGDDRYTLCVIYSFEELESQSDLLLEDFIQQYKMKYSPFFKYKEIHPVKSLVDHHSIRSIS
jgi:hypothetical protein